MTDIEVESRDVGQLDKVVRHRGWVHTDSQDHVTTRNQTKQEELPEELMAELTEHLGDGLAKVTVGAELGHSKEYGCKAQAFVSISVHCNNDDDTIQNVQSILHGKARSFVNKDLENMLEDRNDFIQRDKSQDASPPGKVARTGGGGKSRAKRRGTSKKSTPKAGTKPKGKARARPDYRR